MPTAAHQETNRLFPPKTSKGRQPYGAVSKQKVVAVRPPLPLADFLAKQEEVGYSRTEALLKIAFVGMESAEELGADWWEVERRAAEEGVTSGQALARLARESIERHRKGKR